MDKISVLILTEYTNDYYASSDYDLLVSRTVPVAWGEPFDIVFVDKNPDSGDMVKLLPLCRPHRVYITERVTNSVNRNSLVKRKCGKTLSSGEINHFIRTNGKYFFKYHYGDKFTLDDLTVSRNYNGKIQYSGNNEVILEGDFGNEMSQVMFFRNNVAVEKNQEIDFWLEYSTTGDVEISVELTAYLNGSVAKVLDKTEFKSFMLNDLITYGGFDAPVDVFVSIKARGTGSLRFVSMHYRPSRGMNGVFMVGGARYVTRKREEIFAYFEPGDLKPPLNIYFSGYKTKEGFEGYELMKRLGSPFLLISEARLEGGNFYLGDYEFEQTIRKIIQYYMDYLEISNKEVVMAGLSMGAYGALFYACDLQPHAVILGKPLMNLGDIAFNEKRFRPSGFPTSLDVLKRNTSSPGDERIEILNNRMWKRYETADWSDTKLIVAHLIEDDYDSTAYEKMLSRIRTPGATVYGKGIHGRHNDNTEAVVNWFLGQFESVINDDFQKEKKGNTK